MSSMSSSSNQRYFIRPSAALAGPPASYKGLAACIDTPGGPPAPAGDPRSQSVAPAGRLQGAGFVNSIDIGLRPVLPSSSWAAVPLPGSLDPMWRWARLRDTLSSSAAYK